MKYILISGPPGSGKDTVAKMINRHFTVCDDAHPEVWNPIQEKFAYPLIEAAKSLGFDMSENVKDKPDPRLGVTRRNFAIEFSETLCKPLMGQRVFGNALVARTINKDTQYVIVSDSGFLPEAEAVVDAIGVENVIRLHLIRPGHDYSNDSRSDWPCPGGMVRYTINNIHDSEYLYKQVLSFCREISNDKPK